MSARPTTIAVVLLALAGTALVLDHQRLDSPTMDEPFHALAAAEYALGGTYYANLEHPPLAKLLAGVFLGEAGARRPAFPRPFDMAGAEQPAHFCFRNRIPPHALFAAARRPFPALFFLLVLLTAAAAWRYGGPLAAVSAAALVAFEPNLVAHAGVLHTDVPAALGFLATVFAALAAIERRSLALWGAAGLLLGLTLATKFTAVFLVPVLLLLALFATLSDRRRAEREGRPPDLHAIRGALLAAAIGGVVLMGVYAVALRSMPASEAERAVRIFLGQRLAPDSTIERVARLSRLFPPLGHYAAGLEGIASQNETGGGVNFLHGRLSVAGFWDYFFVAFAVKSALGLLAVLAAAAAVAALGRVRPGFALGGLLLPVAYLFASGAATSYNIGIRHMLPAYPFLIVVAAAVVARGLAGRAALALLLGGAALQLVETAAVHPHEMSFFNAAAGGPARGAEWLNDSNLDWGQDLTRLGIELRRRGVEGETTIAYFGGGSPVDECPSARFFDPASTPVGPGLYAVSSYLLCAGPELLAWRGDGLRSAGYERLRRAVRSRGEPAGRVGYSILLFRIPAEGPPSP